MCVTVCVCAGFHCGNECVLLCIQRRTWVPQAEVVSIREHRQRGRTRKEPEVPGPGGNMDMGRERRSKVEEGRNRSKDRCRKRVTERDE